MGEHTKAKAVEKKVSLATLGAFIPSSIVAVLNAWEADSSLMGGLPGWLQAVVIALGPTAVTFLGGYLAPHTPRPPK